MAFTPRWSTRLTARWPQVRILRVFSQDGTSYWEVHLTPRQIAPPAQPPPPAAEKPEEKPEPATLFTPAVPSADLPRRPTAPNGKRNGFPARSPYTPPPRPSPPATSSPAPSPPAPPPPAPPTPSSPAPSSPAPPSPAPPSFEPEPPLQPRVPYTWIQLRRTPEGVESDVERVVNRYMVTIHAPVDLGEALRRPRVADVLHRLTRDPDDRRLREDVVAELTSVPCPDPFATTIFDLATLSTSGDESFLDGLLVMRNQGIQVGGQGLRPTHFTYLATATLLATKVLEADPELAGALVDHLCPTPSGIGNAAALDKLLRKAIDEPDPGAGRVVRPQRRAGSERGTILRIEHLDGVLAGSQGVQVTRLDANRVLELDRRTIELHPHLGEYLAALSDQDTDGLTGR